MKKIIIIIVVLTTILTACQPTPKEEVVVGKGKEQIDNMLDKAVITPEASTQSDSLSTEPIPLEYEAPERLKYKLNSKLTGAEITVDIDAPVILPENAPPIVSVKPKNISYEQLSGLLNLVKDDQPLYHSAYTECFKLKCDMQKSIDNYMWEISMCKDDPEMKNIKNSYQKRIKNLYKEIETAPETYDEIKVTEGSEVKAVPGGLILPKRFIGPFSFTKDNYDDENYDFIIGQGSASDRLEVNTKNDSKDVQRINYYHFNDKVVDRHTVKAEIIPNIMDGFDFSKEEAIKIAKPFVDAIDSTLCLVDVGDAVFTDLYKDDLPQYPFGYTLYYARNYNGIDTNFSESSTFDEEYWNQKLYPQEYLTITVGKEGVFYLTYTSPLEIIDEVASSVELLPFEKIKEKFDSQIVLNTQDADDRLFLKINRVELSMMRIAKPDSDEYLVIPVWDFYGGSIEPTTSDDTDEECLNELTEFYGRSFLTINAIDGSVIDRKLGY